MTGGTVISIISIAISVAAFVNAFTFPGGTSDGVPGAGVFPQALCVIIIAINVILIIQNLRVKHPKTTMSEEHKEGAKRLAMLVVATIVMLVLWGRIHFVILCSLYLISIGWILKQRMTPFIPGAVIGASFIYFIFQRLLNVML